MKSYVVLIKRKESTGNDSEVIKGNEHKTMEALEHSSLEIFLVRVFSRFEMPKTFEAETNALMTNITFVAGNYPLIS